MKNRKLLLICMFVSISLVVLIKFNLRSGTVNKDPLPYTIPNDLLIPSSIMILDSGKIYEKDDSKNISVSFNKDVEFIKGEENKSKFIELFKNKKCIEISSRELTFPGTTKDKNIYTKIKYQFQSSFRGDGNGNYPKGFSPGTGDIYNDGTF